MIYEDDELIDENGQEQDAVTTRTSSGGTLALALLAGAAIGAAVALMMAPRTGQDMRRVLRKRAEGLRDTAGGVLDETTEELRRQIRRRGRQVRRQMERMG
jgi:gas vesicle protein